MDIRPVPSDLTTEDVMELAEGKGKEMVAERLQTTADRIGYLVANNPEALDMIKAMQAEMEVWGRLRVAMMVPQALDTLEKVMDERGDEKTSMAAEKAAEAVLDRSYLPRQSSRIIQQQMSKPDTQHALPSVDQLLEQAETDSEAFELVKRHRDLMREVEALRQGAKEIIDVRPQEKTQPKS